MWAHSMGVQARVNSSSKRENTPTCAPPQENPKPKTENCFFDAELLDLLNP